MTHPALCLASIPLIALAVAGCGGTSAPGRPDAARADAQPSEAARPGAGAHPLDAGRPAVDAQASVAGDDGGAPACEAAPGSHPVTRFGVFAPDDDTAEVVTANSATLHRALDEIGRAGGGTVCLPAGVYHLAPADLTKPGAAAVNILHDDLVLAGAGRGRTVLRTRSAFSLVAGKVVRGNGIRIWGTRDRARPRRNITLRDFELDGGAGYTGNFAWPANPNTGDGWDITHKGIVISADDHVDGVVLERIHVHRYRGEVIYAGGLGLGRVALRHVRSEDTNASTFNITANFVVEDSEFGKSMMWAEIGTRFPGKAGVFRRCRFRDAAKNGVVFAQGDGMEQAYLFEENTFEAGETGFGFFGGVGGPITIRKNTFRQMGAILSFGFAPGAITALNQKVAFEQNRIESSALLAAFGGRLADVVVRDNQFVGRGGGMSTAIFYGSGVGERVTVADNTFERCRTPEQVAVLRGGERPLFRGNRYVEVERRELQGQFRVKPGDIVSPRFEELRLIPSGGDVPIAFETTGYPEGQEVTVTGGGPAAGLLCRPDSPSVRCSAGRALRGPERLVVRFDAAAGVWREVAFQTP